MFFLAFLPHLATSSLSFDSYAWDSSSFNLITASDRLVCDMLTGSSEAGPSQWQSSSLFCRQRTTSILRSSSRTAPSSDTIDGSWRAQRRRRIAAFSPSPLEDLSSNDAAISSRRKLSRAEKDILFGSLAGMVAKVFEHPL